MYISRSSLSSEELLPSESKIQKSKRCTQIQTDQNRKPYPTAWTTKMCQEIPRGYSRKRENVKVLTKSGEQRGQDQNDKNTTLKTKKQMKNMDPTKKLGVDSGAPEE